MVRRSPLSFSLRSALLVTTVVAILLILIPMGQHRYVVCRDGVEYDKLVTSKDAYLRKQRERLATIDKNMTRKLGKTKAINGGRPIPDDFVVLLRKGDSLGAFIPRDQGKNGESLRYDWFYRSDGKADLESHVVTSGTSSSEVYRPGVGHSSYVEFGPFKLQWSGHDRGWGFLYYPDENEQQKEPLFICTTSRKSIDGIDAKSEQWLYKSSN